MAAVLWLNALGIQIFKKMQNVVVGCHYDNVMVSMLLFNVRPVTTIRYQFLTVLLKRI